MKSSRQHFSYFNCCLNFRLSPVTYSIYDSSFWEDRHPFKYDIPCFSHSFDFHSQAYKVVNGRGVDIIVTAFNIVLAALSVSVPRQVTISILYVAAMVKPISIMKFSSRTRVGGRHLSHRNKELALSVRVYLIFCGNVLANHTQFQPSKKLKIEVGKTMPT